MLKSLLISESAPFPIAAVAEAEQILAADQHLVSPGKDLNEGKEAEGKDGGKEAEAEDAALSHEEAAGDKSPVILFWSNVDIPNFSNLIF